MAELPSEYLKYPRRKYGMDHDFYDWSIMQNRPKFQWQQGKQVTVFINLNLEFFPLDQNKHPFQAPGGMKMPYPDLRHFTLRDYGNRVGIYRLLEVTERLDIKPSFSINGQMVDRHPLLIKEIKKRDAEIIAHGWSMNCPHYGGMERELELEYIRATKARLETSFEKEVTGWLSPGKSQSENTPDLLVESGFSFMMDWVNDELPYAFNTKKGGIVSFPLSTEIEDRFVLLDNLHSESEWVEQAIDSYKFLYEEAEQEECGRLLTLNIHPWILGQAHRAKYFEQTLSYLKGQEEVCFASAQSIIKMIGLGFE